MFYLASVRTRPSREILKKRLDTLLPKEGLPVGQAKAIAKSAGIHVSTLSNWRTGKVDTNLKLDTLDGLASALAAVLRIEIGATDLISEAAPLPTGLTDDALDQAEAAAMKMVEEVRRLRKQRSGGG